MKTCFIPGCVRKYECRGLCNKHYIYYRNNKLRFPAPADYAKESETAEQRLLRYRSINKSTGCWNWTGRTKPNGYGMTTLTIGPKQLRHMHVHRLSWEVFRGVIPDGMCVCHHCDNRKCINPDHLFLGTHQDNMRDMKKKGRAHDRRGTKNHRAILDEDAVREIRRAPRYYGYIPELAERYGVAPATISEIVGRRCWEHI